MFYVNTHDEKGLKGSKVCGTFMDRVDGFDKFFIVFSNGSILAMEIFASREDMIDPEEVVKRLGYEVTLDKGPLARSRECEQTVISPDMLEEELRRIRSRIFNSEMIALYSMKIPGDRELCFAKLGKRFEKWYLSLRISK